MNLTNNDINVLNATNNARVLRDIAYAIALHKANPNGFPLARAVALVRSFAEDLD